MTGGIAGHEPRKSATDVWLTPKELLDVLGHFDLDPCAATNRPWPTAMHHYVEAQDGLSLPWFGRVWCNPPYSAVGPWLARLAAHGCGLALVFARTETAVWHEHVWDKAHGVLFLRGRLAFARESGETGRTAEGKRTNAGAPSALVAYCREDAALLASKPWPGRYVGLLAREDELPICSNCGNDLVCEGYPYCSECLEEMDN